ncbi:MAG: hypothetical protein HY012_05775, partial [Acidobacteria bacterium]|nr:hypothetical protein [Acidobacteriota bacterium]
MRATTISLDELGARFEKIASVAERTTAIGVADAQAGAYARVIEYGSIAGQRPWPHPGEGTVAAVNPETGAQVVVSAQAPQGFIRVRAPEFLNQLREAVAGPADWLDAQELDQHFASALQSAAAHALE